MAYAGGSKSTETIQSNVLGLERWPSVKMESFADGSHEDAGKKEKGSEEEAKKLVKKKQRAEVTFCRKRRSHEGPLSPKNTSAAASRVGR